MAPPSSWSDLPLDLAGNVLRHLPRHADRVRFAAVCRQWRSSARQSPLPPQYPWLALPDRTFYSLPDSAFQRLPLHLDRHRQLPYAQSSCGEWLLFERQDGAYTLVSPFSMAATILLPGLSDSYARKEPFRVVHEVPVPSLLKLVVCNGSGGLLVAAILDEEWPFTLALCRPGASSSWSRSDHNSRLNHLQDMAWHQGKLYAYDRRNGLFHISISTNDGGEPTVTGFHHLIDRILTHFSPKYLLGSITMNGGALLLVDRWHNGCPDPWVGAHVEMATTFTVLEADVARCRWTEVSSIGDDQVLFVGPWCSRAVGVESGMGDRIFFLEDDTTRGEGYSSGRYQKREPFFCSVYDMRSRRSELFMETSARPLKRFPVTWLFPPSQPGLNNCSSHPGFRSY